MDEVLGWRNASEYSLNRRNVTLHAPQSSGVYGLRNSTGWVYVGQCPNIQKALLEYLAGYMPYVLQAQPNSFTFEVCSPRERVDRQRELARVYQPTANKKHLTQGG